MRSECFEYIYSNKFYGAKTKILIIVFLSLFAADEEKLDERAKLSVAAKRSLFRVSCLLSLGCFISSDYVLVPKKKRAQRNMLPIRDTNIDSA